MKKSLLFKFILLTVATFVGSEMSAQNRRTNVTHAQIAGYNSETKLPNVIRFNPGMEIQASEVES